MVRQILSNNNEKCYRNLSPKIFTSKHALIPTAKSFHLQKSTTISVRFKKERKKERKEASAIFLWQLKRTSLHIISAALRATDSWGTERVYRSSWSTDMIVLSKNTERAAATSLSVRLRNRGVGCLYARKCEELNGESPPKKLIWQCLVVALLYKFFRIQYDLEDFIQPKLPLIKYALQPLDSSEMLYT
jgi:hypothetical protein